MPIQYDSKKLIPSPLVNISQEYVKTGDTIVGNLYRITLAGQFVANKGSPTSSGTWHTVGGYPNDEVLSHDEHLKSILVKQSALRELFSTEGKSLEIQPWDGSAPLKCNPRIVSVDIPEGQWYNTAQYTVVLEADTLYGAYTTNGETALTGYITDAKEEWNVELGDQVSYSGVYSYRLTHTLSAVGKKHYESDGSYIDPWTNARTWVNARLGIDWTRAYASGVLNAPTGSLLGYNHVRSQNVDELGGSFSVTESWILSPQAYTEDFTVETRTSIDNGLSTVSIQGSYQGYELRDTNYTLTSDKYAVLSSLTDSVVKSTALFRAQTYSSVSLNIIPNSTLVGRNPVAGTINYSCEYDNRPSNLLEDAISEVITINDKNPNDVFASLQVLGRTVGPVLQNMNTITSKERTLTIDAIFTPSNDLLSKPNVSGIIVLVRPDAEGYSTYYTTQDDENWNSKVGKYTRNITWLWNPGEG